MKKASEEDTGGSTGTGCAEASPKPFTRMGFVEPTVCF
jgi:hypothetical protein